MDGCRKWTAKELTQLERPPLQRCLLHPSSARAPAIPQPCCLRGQGCRRHLFRPKVMPLRSRHALSCDGCWLRCRLLRDCMELCRLQARCAGRVAHDQPVPPLHPPDTVFNRRALEVQVCWPLPRELQQKGWPFARCGALVPRCACILWPLIRLPPPLLLPLAKACSAAGLAELRHLGHFAPRSQGHCACSSKTWAALVPMCAKEECCDLGHTLEACAQDLEGHAMLQAPTGRGGRSEHQGDETGPVCWDPTLGGTTHQQLDKGTTAGVLLDWHAPRNGGVCPPRRLWCPVREEHEQTVQGPQQRG